MTHGSVEFSLEAALRQLVREEVEAALSKLRPAAPAPATDGLMTVAEVSDYLGISEAAVRNRAKRGQLPAIKLGSSKRARVRFRRDQLDSWIEEQQ
jgi:excisionase family DNA binding protein